MTLTELATLLMQDAQQRAPRRIRGHTNENRAYRAASIAIAQRRRMSDRGDPVPVNVERLATEAAELERREQAGLILGGISMILLQAVMSWLIQRALDRLMEIH